MTRRAAVRRLRSEPLQPILPDRKPLHPELLYTESEVARFLRLSNKTLCIWRCRQSQPGLRYRKVGSRVLYLGADVLKFLDGNGK